MNPTAQECKKWLEDYAQDHSHININQAVFILHAAKGGSLLAIDFSSRDYDNIYNGLCDEHGHEIPIEVVVQQFNETWTSQKWHRLRQELVAIRRKLFDDDKADLEDVLGCLAEIQVQIIMEIETRKEKQHGASD